MVEPKTPYMLCKYYSPNLETLIFYTGTTITLSLWVWQLGMVISVSR